MTRKERWKWVLANRERLLTNIHFGYASCVVLALLIGFPFMLWERGPTLELFVACGFFAALAWAFFSTGIRTVEEQITKDR